MYNIYKIINDANSLIYIGCTTKSIEKRFREHLTASDVKSNDFYRAIRDIGKEHFHVELIEHGEDDDIRYERERYFISKYNSNDERYGYNRTIGGLGTIGYEFTDEARRKISLGNMGRKPTQKMLDRISKLNKGKHLSKECRDKISKSRLGKYTGKDNPFFGKHHTDETKKKILKSKKELGLLRAVIGTNTSDGSVVEFDSLADAARFVIDIRGGKLSTVISHIGNSIVGRYKSKSAYGYKWAYKEKSNDYPDRE